MSDFLERRALCVWLSKHAVLHKNHKNGSMTRDDSRQGARDLDDVEESPRRGSQALCMAWTGLSDQAGGINPSLTRTGMSRTQAIEMSASGLSLRLVMTGRRASPQLFSGHVTNLALNRRIC